MYLTDKEQHALEARLNLEQMLVRKYSALSCLSCGAALTGTFSEIAEKHRRHYHSLLTVLQEGEHHAESK